MRKHTTFAMAAMILGLSTMFWIKSGVVATGADAPRPQAGPTNYIVTPITYLPFQVMEPIY